MVHRDRGATGVGRGDIVAGPQIERRLGQPVKLDELAPSVALGEASAHGAPLVYRACVGRLTNTGYAAHGKCFNANR
jgi:hypothetical protein